MNHIQQCSVQRLLCRETCRRTQSIKRSNEIQRLQTLLGTSFFFLVEIRVLPGLEAHGEPFVVKRSMAKRDVHEGFVAMALRDET